MESGVRVQNIKLADTLKINSGDDFTVNGKLEAKNVDATGAKLTVNGAGSTVTDNCSIDELIIAGSGTLKVGTLSDYSNIDVSGFTGEGTALVVENGTIDASKVNIGTHGTKHEVNASPLFEKDYTLGVSANKITNVGTVTGVRENSKSYVETQMATLAMVASGADLLANAGFTNAAQAVQDAKDSGDSGRSMVPYAAANYGSMRQESGSHVDVKGSNFNIGFAKEVKNSNGKLLFGPMFEYGRGNYDSYLDDGTTGSGTAQNYGVGIMARQDNDNGFYYEGSVRYGKVTSDYSSSNVWAGHDVSYDNSAKYWGAHVGVGKLQKLGGDNAIDLYGKLFYTNQGSSSVNIDGDTLDFSAVKSKRSRIGFRYIHGTSAVRSIYAGLAWQYEFDGSAYATANGFSTPSPSVKGSSGMLELGVLIAPKASPVSFDLGVSGWTGKQKGYSLNANMCWSF
ncbi:MAG: autotransporter outer membrane beta-barrel domain-containing protein [Anaerovibrio sp.]